MMKKIMLLLSLFCCSSLTQAAEWGVLGGVNKFYPSSNGTVNGGTGALGGFFFSIPVGVENHIEVDAIFVHQTYDFGSAATETSINAFQIPGFLRFSILPLVNVGLGVYYGMGLNYPSTLNKSDFGLTSSAQIKIPFLSGVDIIGDLRYCFGLTNLSNSGGSFKNRQVNLLAGLGFSI